MLRCRQAGLPLLPAHSSPHAAAARPCSPHPPRPTCACSEELGRPENRDLKPLVERLRTAKDAIDARRQPGQNPLTWADTIVLAAKVSQELAWREDKISKAASRECTAACLLLVRGGSGVGRMGGELAAAAGGEGGGRAAL